MPRHLMVFIFAVSLSAQLRAATPIDANSSNSNSSSSVSTQTKSLESEQNAEALGEAEKTTYLICKNKASVRTLRVLTNNNGSCITTYTKDGVDQTVSHSWQTQRCSKVLANIRINLEKAQWKCKDISEARVSSSE